MQNDDVKEVQSVGSPADGTRGTYAPCWTVVGEYIVTARADGSIPLNSQIIATLSEVSRDALPLIIAAPDLLSIARRWAALDGGAWHVERHAAEKQELLADTRAAISKAQSS